MGEKQRNRKSKKRGVEGPPTGAGAAKEHNEAFWKSLYAEKNQYLDKFCEEVSPREFYRELWPEGSFEREGHPEDGKPNGLALSILGKGRAYHEIITDGLEQLDELLQRKFVVTAPIGYFGRRRTGENARACYALVFDLDGVEMPQLQDCLYQMGQEIIPKATYVVNSGHGLHLYYFLEMPPAMTPPIQACLKELKYALTRQIWNAYTSTRKDVEVQGVLQGFRMVGSPSKMGADYPVRAFRYGDAVTLDYLMGFVPVLSGEREKIFSALESRTSLQEAAKKWPEWYQRRVVEGQPRGRWTVKRDLYDWWLRRLRNEVVVGHRFYAVMTLAIYAVKCGIDEEELRRDAYSLLEAYDAMSISQDNRFTEDDIETALTAYLDSYTTFPRDDIAKYSGLTLKPNKRNGRNQQLHLKLARASRDILCEERGKSDWREGAGRPKGSGTAAEKVAAYRQEHPDARKADCIRETGLSKPTVYKWWDAEISYRYTPAGVETLDWHSGESLGVTPYKSTQKPTEE